MRFHPTSATGSATDKDRQTIGEKTKEPGADSQQLDNGRLGGEIGAIDDITESEDVLP
jgi:hypothetical protein